MEETTTITRADALAAHARALRRYYGNRLRALYVLRNDPYPRDEPDEADPEAESLVDRLYLVAVLSDRTIDHSREVGVLTHLADRVNQEIGDRFITMVYPVSAEDFAGRKSYPARSGRDEGIRL